MAVCEWSECSAPGAGASAWCVEHRPTTWSVENLLGDLTGATVEFHPGGAVNHVDWLRDEDRHREDGPAALGFDSEGRFRISIWNRAGRIHRVGGPAMVSLSERQWTETFYDDGDLHRLEGPAALFFSLDGGLHREAYYRMGLAHRGDGPAIVSYLGDGTPVDEVFALDGVRVTEAEVESYAEAVTGGAMHEWALAYALGTAG